MNNGLLDGGCIIQLLNMALALTVQASPGKTQEYHRQQGMGLENNPLWVAWQCLTHCHYKGTYAPESGKIGELKWLRFSDYPSMWWDNRAKHWNNYPDFKHAFRGESLWIGSSYCANWVEDGNPALGRGIREGQWPRFQIVRSSYLETKHTETDSRETIRSCNEVQHQTVETNISILLAALKVSISSRDLETGKKIHAHAIESGDESNIYVASTLVHLYAKCGSMGDARGVFDRMPRHNVVSWTALMLGYAENGEDEVALQLFACMRPEGCGPDARTFVAALKACTNLAAKEEGKQVDWKLVKMGSVEKGMAIHSQAAKTGCDSEIYVANTLVGMYAECGTMVDARGVFDQMPRHDVVSWNALMLGYAENGESEVALQLFARMSCDGCAPDGRSFVAALKAGTSLAAKEEGKQVDGKPVKMGSLEKGMTIHFEAAKVGCDSENYVANTLVDMYAKCGSMVDAHGVFHRMSRHDVVSWNALMLGYAENGEGEVALQLFACMRFERCAADARTFVAALKACSSLAAKEEGKRKLGSLEKGMAIHSEAAKSGCDSEIYVANTLVDVYAKCGSVVDACGVFDQMPFHDVVSWNALLLGYAENGEGEVALHLFTRMRFEGCAPDAGTIVAALKACTSLAAKEDGKQVAGKLVKMGSLEMGMAIHFHAANRGFDSKIHVANTLVDMYAKCGSLVDARAVFQRMPRHDVVSWNALMLGYAQNGEGEVAVQLFDCIGPEGCAPDARTFVAALKACTILAEKEEGKQVDRKLVKLGSMEKGMAIHSQAAKSVCDADIFVASTLVDMYAKCGSMVDARGVFDRMLGHDVVSWSAIILGYAENGEGEVALQLFSCMRPKGCAPDALTFVAALKACGTLAALEIGRAIHADIRRCGLENNAVVANCLVDFYGKCGSMVDAQQVFDSLATKDLVTWTALIAGYGCQGDTTHVFNLFERMQKERVHPNAITFISILTACSHAGLVEKGKEYFQAMWSNYGINPAIEHYHCMVDILGRANQLDDAVAMVKTMPFKPNVVTWMTVLGACWKWKNVAVGRLAFESLLRLDENEPATYVLMGNIYGSVGMWENKSEVDAMRNGKKHVLVKMKEQGYVADVARVLNAINQQTSEAQHRKANREIEKTVAATCTDFVSKLA